MRTTQRFNKHYLWLILAVIFILITVFSFAQNRDNNPVKVKIVKIVDEDTSTIEKTMNESSVQDFMQQFENIKGKNVQVMVTVEGKGEDKKKSNSTSSMHFNFDMDSATAGSFSKIFMLNDSVKEKNFAWNDNIMKNISKDFDFNFNFDKDGSMNDFDFSIEIDKDGKTVTIKKNGEQTIVINEDDDSAAVSDYKTSFGESEGVKAQTKTKTIVINDEKNKSKKKVIVSTSVMVIDMDDEPSKSDKRKGNEEENFKFYPNPSDGNFILDIDLNGNDEALVSIIDMNGKEVYKEKILAESHPFGTGKGKTSKIIDLGNEKKGTFIVTIKQGKKTSSKKIIIE